MLIFQFLLTPHIPMEIAVKLKSSDFLDSKEITTNEQTEREAAGSLRSAVVSLVAFRAKGRGFKSANVGSHNAQKPSISQRLFGQCTLKLNVHLPFTIIAGGIISVTGCARESKGER